MISRISSSVNLFSLTIFNFNIGVYLTSFFLSLSLGVLIKSFFSIKKANELGLELHLSNNTRYKISVYNPSNTQITNIGQYGSLSYCDYLYYEDEGLYKKGFAELKRQQYISNKIKRHSYSSKTLLSKYSSYLNDYILWGIY
jgi:hypothetical protein